MSEGLGLGPVGAGWQFLVSECPSQLVAVELGGAQLVTEASRLGHAARQLLLELAVPEESQLGRVGEAVPICMQFVNLPELRVAGEVIEYDQRGVLVAFEDRENVLDIPVEAPIAAEPSQPLVLDFGGQLLLPLTFEEYAGTEKILALLQQAIENEELSELDVRRLQTMVDYLSEARRDTEPGKTERWKLVGSVRSTLKYLHADFPVRLVAWDKAIEILQGIGWRQLAAEIAKAVG